MKKISKLKVRICTILALALVFMTFSTASAILYSGSSDTWSETFSYNPQVNNDPPEVIGTSITVIDDGPGAMLFQAGLAVSVYQYNAYGSDKNYAHLRVAVTTKSTAVGSFLPVYASNIIIIIEKTGFYDEQAVEVQDSGVMPYSQGNNILQPSNTRIEIPLSQRTGLAGYTLQKALGVILGEIPGWSAIEYLISIGDAFDSVENMDYNDAEFGSDTRAYCWWNAEPLDFGTTNPIEQYCFNTLFWIHERDNPGAGGYGIDVWAKIIIDGSAIGFFGETEYYTPKLHLRINRQPSAGGGGRRLF